MALTALSEDEQRIVFSQLCNVLDPRGAVDFSSTNSGLWVLTQALQQQLRTDHEAVAALCHKTGMGSCKELREAKEVKLVNLINKGLSAADLGLLGTLGSVLPALEKLVVVERSAGAAGPDGLQRLAEGLGAGALPSVNTFAFASVHVGDAGASALAAALGRGALPRLTTLALANAAITDAGLVALAPALRRWPALECLLFNLSPFGDEGFAALVAPPLAAGALAPPTGGLTTLRTLSLHSTQVSDAGCATLVAALDSGALPALEVLNLVNIPASAAARVAVCEALGRSKARAAALS